MLNVALMAVIAVLSASDATTVAPASVSPPASSAKPAEDPMDHVVCHVEETTGSRLGGHKVCMTQRDWVALQRQNGQDLREGRQRGLTTGHDRGG
jgi:hypothetical protein